MRQMGRERTGASDGKWRRRATGALLLAAATVSAAIMAGAAHACGPWFPDGFLYNGREQEILSLPGAFFGAELGSLTGEDFTVPPDRGFHYDPSAGLRKHKNQVSGSLSSDASDLEHALLARQEVAALVAAWQKQSLAFAAPILSAALSTEALETKTDAGSIASDYAVMRRAMRAASVEKALYLETPPLYWFSDRWWELKEVPSADPNAFQLAHHSELLDRLPAEFRMYVHGADAYRRGAFREAIEQWQMLLALPEPERRFRSTWASYMIGKAWLREDPGQAAAWFEQTRAFAAAGFLDSDNLAESSWGWQAFGELKAKEYRAAAHHYVKEFESAPLEARSLRGLRAAAQGLVLASPVPEEYVQDSLCRQMAAAVLPSLSRHRSAAAVRNWAKALEDAAVDVHPDEAARIAWAAYQAGDMATARTWATSGEANAIARWVQSKLLLRDGKLNEAAALLKELCRTPSPDNSHVYYHPESETTPWLVPVGKLVRAELGVIQLCREDFVDAMDALLRAGYWEDAAYVAERVLTVDELEAYVQEHRGEAWLDEPMNTYQHVEDRMSQMLPYLLARRLVREGAYERAREYLGDTTIEPLYGSRRDEEPTPVKDVLQQYLDAVQRGRDNSQKKAIRAEALFEAAAILHDDGFHLMGAEGEPDWHSTAIHAYYYLGASFYRIRIPIPENVVNDQAYERRTDPANLADRVPSEPFMPSAEEKRRVLAHPIEPNRRYHYRYVAAEHAWEGAKLLPDNDPLLAEMLYTAGNWIAAKDPEAADKFYKALVRRCPGLPIGQEAEKQRWFPENGEELIKAMKRSS